MSRGLIESSLSVPTDKGMGYYAWNGWTLNREGVSLRNWLIKQQQEEVNKREKLQIYKQVVQVVDMAHSQGNALQDLRLSNFVLLPSNQIVYSTQDSYSVIDQLEKNWYACPQELCGKDLLSANIYSLGILLFEVKRPLAIVICIISRGNHWKQSLYSYGVEILCSFVSLETHSAAILDLGSRILPKCFISDNPREAGLCLWLLDPSRPTTREILQCELLSDLYPQSTYSLIAGKSEDMEFEMLLDFLASLKEQKEKQALELNQYIQLLETDMDNFQHKNVSRMFYDSNINISQLESAYFSNRSQLQLGESVSIERNGVDLLRNRDRLSTDSVGVKEHIVQEKYVDDFLNGICKFIRYSKFEVSGMLEFGNLLNSVNVICSLSFDPDENYIAAAGISKKIKIYEFVSLLDDSVEVNYPAVELLNKSKLSCVCWNKYLKNYLASSDYDGVVQVWDAFTGQQLTHYTEHQGKAYCVDFSHMDPAQFASGSDDCSVKLWSLNNKTSTCTIRSDASVCCVQFSSCSSHMLAFGSADCKIHCYDLRHTRIPWCTLANHQNAVSYVNFLGSDSLVSASTDSTLKLWDLKKTSLEGISTDACCMTYRGHSNEKNFVGLSVLDGYIACGSESNEVYVYHKSFPMPITSYKFESTDSDDINAQFVSSVCWREKSNMIVAANSGGSLKVLKMV